MLLAERHGGFYGITNDDTGSIAVTDEVRGHPWHLRYVLLHEMGHGIGIEDDQADGGLMDDSGFLLEEPCIDAHALELACRAVGCGPNAHPTCD